MESFNCICLSKRLLIGGGAAIDSAEITADVNTSIYVAATRTFEPFYPTVSGATLVPGAIVNDTEDKMPCMRSIEGGTTTPIPRRATCMTERKRVKQT